ncbi:hypothetical protein [Actinomadura sp. NEAU-AAG7]|uniref:hypothetical protein n=1 Tax=Actinomadura sp. NEAU-AAG7 TaxID=2839640 RepID=UPI001BE4B346|nr:hypothetical protein [Actinomadura sp. NEAU-AAG7]MBT2207038.1 hypothetical protein [Actinomadura sp. NEAU-AAG7]
MNDPTTESPAPWCDDSTPEPAGVGFGLEAGEQLAAHPFVRRARTVLAESKATEPSGKDGDSAGWWGRLEATLENVLAAIDEEADR